MLNIWSQLGVPCGKDPLALEPQPFGLLQMGGLIPANGLKDGR